MSYTHYLGYAPHNHLVQGSLASLFRPETGSQRCEVTPQNIQPVGFRTQTLPTPHALSTVISSNGFYCHPHANGSQVFTYLQHLTSLFSISIFMSHGHLRFSMSKFNSSASTESLALLSTNMPHLATWQPSLNPSALPAHIPQVTNSSSRLLCLHCFLRGLATYRVTPGPSASSLSPLKAGFPSCRSEGFLEAQTLSHDSPD